MNSPRDLRHLRRINVGDAAASLCTRLEQAQNDASASERVSSSETQTRMRDVLGAVETSLSDMADRFSEHQRDRNEISHTDRLFSMHPDGIWEWPDTSLNEMWWSPACYRLLGYLPNAFPARLTEWLLRVHPEDREIIRRSTLAGQDRCYVEVHQNFDYRMLHADGQYRWFRHRTIIEYDDNGRPNRMMGAFSDIHHLRVAEEQKQEEIKRRDKFLAMLSHELRNPLNAICAAAHLLSTNKVNEDIEQEARQVLQRQTQQMSRLLDDLLDVSRVTQDKIRLNSVRIDLVTSVVDAIEAVKNSAHQRDIQIRLETGGACVWIDGDATRIEQIAMNLLSNAIKYSPDHSQITVTVLSDPTHAVLSIRDCGAGLSDEAKRQIFDLFYQAAETLERSCGGLGVGLTLVKRLVELHGGTIHAISEGLGRGTEFILRLPLSDPSVSVVPTPHSSPRYQRPRSVLVIEDQPDNRQMLMDILAVNEFDVRGASTGADGLRLIDERRPDAILIDIGLPGMDGFEVAKLLRQQFGRDMTLIALTGYGQAEDVRRCLVSGFDYHAMKPLKVDHLLRMLSGGNPLTDAAASTGS